MMSEKPQGHEKYIPTRLEWLVMLLNVNFEIDDKRHDRFQLFYTSGKDTNTVCISVFHYGDVNKKYMNGRIKAAEEIVSRVAKTYGWDSWLEVEVNVQETESGE